MYYGFLKRNLNKVSAVQNVFKSLLFPNQDCLKTKV